MRSKHYAQIDTHVYENNRIALCGSPSKPLNRCILPNICIFSKLQLLRLNISTVARRHTTKAPTLALRRGDNFYSTAIRQIMLRPFGAV